MLIFLQNRLASTRTDLGGKACSVTGPSLKPRAALGEIGNIAVKKDVQKVHMNCFYTFLTNIKANNAHTANVNSIILIVNMSQTSICNTFSS